MLGQFPWGFKRDADHGSERDRTGGSILDRQISIRPDAVRIIAVDRYIAGAVKFNQPSAGYGRTCDRQTISERANENRSITRCTSTAAIQKHRPGFNRIATDLDVDYALVCSRIDRGNGRGKVWVGGRPEGAGSGFDFNRSGRVAGADDSRGVGLFRRAILGEYCGVRLILPFSLGQGVSAGVEGKGKESEEKTDRAKSKTDQEARVKEGRFGGWLFFHINFVWD